MNQIVLVDGKNQLYRNHYTATAFTREDGHPTGAIHGCIKNSVMAISRRLPDASFVWVWDGLGETWRHRMMSNLPVLNTDEFDEENNDEVMDFQTQMVRTSMQFLGSFKQPTRRKKPKTQGYKANRAHYKNPPAEISGAKSTKKDKYPTDERQRALIQIPILRMILEGSGIRNFEVQGLECDDLLAMLAKRIIELDSEAEVIIMSGDRDYYQMLKYHPQVKIIKGLKDGAVNWVTPEHVYAEYGIKVKHWTKYRALTGDSVDNIPHLWKVGPATSKKMLADGIDPSDASWRHIPTEAQQKYARYFPQGLERMWPAVYGNYKLCQLVTDIESELLSEEVKDRLSRIFDKLTSIDKFKRRKSQLTTENYRKISFLLLQYELAEIHSLLDQFWAIP